jgi:hypothetical protein
MHSPETNQQPKAKFEPVEMKVGNGWYVLATLLRGGPIQLGGFKTEDEARKWIEAKSAVWLKDHEGSRS